MNLKHAFLKEPLLHFLLMGGLIFLADALLASDRKEQIFVDQSSIDYLVKQQERLSLRTYSDEEIDQLIAAYIEDEILYREAYKRGLNQGDTRMRRNMILKLRGLMIAKVKEPSEAQLKDFYQNNLERYTSPEQFQVDHVYFKDESSVSPGLLEELNQGADFRSLSESYFQTYGQSSINSLRSELASLFGEQASRYIVETDSDQWKGPFSSAQGIHFVKRSGITPPKVAAFEQVEPYLPMDWQAAEARKLIDAELDSVRENYSIVVERTQ
ncbi:peptidylprolyl isomerase [Agarivorans aestuarii]|uniref:peptidylprolyl isomerase n=1 Tax=Agarivorans aestuarii TaxID=1563703 RepID=A0ABU7G6Z3_9ALTE|nr:peptidylprolyl isomerase [Agarivorans aestuarii]MEE1674934.1 peptidylprolyl isomerase [Agarivorans aestuarii]